MRCLRFSEPVHPASVKARKTCKDGCSRCIDHLPTVQWQKRSTDGVSLCSIRLLIGPQMCRAPACLPSAGSTDAPAIVVSTTMANKSQATFSRRKSLLSTAFSAVLSMLLSPPAADALDATSAHKKRTGLSASEVGSIVASDFQERQYYITGQLTTTIYEDDCVFIDPTTKVTGWRPYTAAIASLFDPTISHADLISLKVIDPSTLELQWRLEGALAIGGLKIKPYTGTTHYTLNKRGLISRHEEQWDISTLDAFASVLFPGLGAPPAPPVTKPPLLQL